MMCLPELFFWLIIQSVYILIYFLHPYLDKEVLITLLLRMCYMLLVYFRLYVNLEFKVDKLSQQ